MRANDKKSARVNFSFLMRVPHREILKQMSETDNVTMARIMDEMLGHYLSAKSRNISRAEEQESIADSDELVVKEDIVIEVYDELEALLGLAWLDLTEKQRKVYVYVAMFPDRPSKDLYKLAKTSSQYFDRLRTSDIGITIIKSYGDRNTWSRRAEVYASIMEKAITLNDPAWAQLAMKFMGDDASVVRQIVEGTMNYTHSLGGSNSNKILGPAEVDDEFMELGRRYNMTPQRYQLLYDKHIQPRLTSATNGAHETEIIDVEEIS